MALSPEAKLFLYYIECKVNPAGVWEANFRLAEQQIGRKMDWPAIIAEINNPKERLIWISESKLWHWTVIPFRYGKELNESSAKAKFQGGLWRCLREMNLLKRLSDIAPDIKISESRTEPAPAQTPARRTKTPQDKINDIDAAIAKWSMHKVAGSKELTAEAQEAIAKLKEARLKLEQEILAA